MRVPDVVPVANRLLSIIPEEFTALRKEIKSLSDWSCYGPPNPCQIDIRGDIIRAIEAQNVPLNCSWKYIALDIAKTEARIVFHDYQNGVYDNNVG